MVDDPQRRVVILTSVARGALDGETRSNRLFCRLPGESSHILIQGHSIERSWIFFPLLALTSDTTGIMAVVNPL